MGKPSIVALVVCVVLAGCGTLLDIQPDPAVPVDDAAVPVDGSPGDGPAPIDASDAADAADVAAPSMPPCASSPPTDPCVLAKDLVSLGSIAVGNGTVYFTKHANPGGIIKVPAGGGAVAPFSVGSMLPAGLFATDTTLYWVTEGDNQIVRQAFGATLNEASTNGATTTAAQIVSVGSNTFWTIPGPLVGGGQVRSSSMTFSPGTVFVPNVILPTAIAADATYVYFASKTSAGHVVRLKHDGTAMTSSTVVYQYINALALSGVGIAAFTSLDGVFRASTQSDATFMGSWTQVSTNSMGVGLVADGLTGTLYVLIADGTLEIIPNLPSPVVTLKTIPGCTAGTALAQDASHVYLACKDTIVRVPK